MFTLGQRQALSLEARRGDELRIVASLPQLGFEHGTFLRAVEWCELANAAGEFVELILLDVGIAEQLVRRVCVRRELTRSAASMVASSVLRAASIAAGGSDPNPGAGARASRRASSSSTRTRTCSVTSRSSSR